MQQGPLMALSAARSRNTHVLMIPSMHADLADDPVTDDIVERLRDEGIDVMWGDLEEGKRKTPNHEHIVARFAHGINVHSKNRKASSSPLVGHIHRFTMFVVFKTRVLVRRDMQSLTILSLAGYDVTCVVGRTSVEQPSWLPLCIKAEQPDEMLAELKALSNDEIHAWVHTAAVLDYVVEAPAEGKLASQ